MTYHRVFLACLVKLIVVIGAIKHLPSPLVVCFVAPTSLSLFNESVQPIISAQPVLVLQEKVNMTLARIWGATFVVDYATRWVKVQLMQDETGDSTLEANNAFEQDCNTRNIFPKY